MPNPANAQDWQQLQAASRDGWQPHHPTSQGTRQGTPSGQQPEYNWRRLPALRGGAQSQRRRPSLQDTDGWLAGQEKTPVDWDATVDDVVKEELHYLPLFVGLQQANQQQTASSGQGWQPLRQTASSQGWQPQQQTASGQSRQQQQTAGSRPSLQDTDGWLAGQEKTPLD